MTGEIKFAIILSVIIWIASGALIFNLFTFKGDSKGRCTDRSDNTNIGIGAPPTHGNIKELTQPTGVDSKPSKSTGDSNVGVLGKTIDEYHRTHHYKTIEDLPGAREMTKELTADDIMIHDKEFIGTYRDFKKLPKDKQERISGRVLKIGK